MKYTLINATSNIVLSCHLTWAAKEHTKFIIYRECKLTEWNYNISPISEDKTNNAEMIWRYNS